MLTFSIFFLSNKGEEKGNFSLDMLSYSSREINPEKSL